MKKGILRKAVSAVLALAFVIALMPTMFASAAEVGDTITFGLSPRLVNKYELGQTATTKITDLKTLNSYVDVGATSIVENNKYYRNWKYFDSNFSGSKGMTASNGLFFSDGNYGEWFALKVRGFEQGFYNVKVNAVPKQGCIWGLYLLDNSIYGSAGTETITAAVENMSDGVTKIGEADLFGREQLSTMPNIYDSADSATSHTNNNTPYNEIEFGTVSLTGNTNTEYILVFRAEKAGVLDGKESNPINSTGATVGTRRYIAMFALSFTKTTAAKNADVFGDTAAFIEHTDSGTSNLYLISAIDSLDYSEVGFKLGDAEESVETDTVYERLTMTNDDDSTLSYTAADFGLSGKYLYVVKKTLTEGFAGQTINFKPYAVSVDGETTIEGSTYQATLKSN